MYVLTFHTETSGFLPDANFPKTQKLWAFCHHQLDFLGNCDEKEVVCCASLQISLALRIVNLIYAKSH